MTSCERLRADAPGLAALAPDDPERVAAWSHARGCPECARALQEAERLQSVLAQWEPAPLAPAALERASVAILEELRRESRRRAIATAAAAGAALLALVGLARERAGTGGDWATVAVLGGLALGLGAVAHRRPLVALGVAAAAALAAALMAGASGGLAVTQGFECLAVELGSAVVVVGAGWFALRGGTTAPAPQAMAASAAVGALAGDAALQVICAAHHAIPHLLAFHVGGLVVAAAGASLLWKLGRRVPA
jgi:hypothetical protein